MEAELFLFLRGLENDSIPAFLAYERAVNRKENLLPWAERFTAVRARLVSPLG